VQVSRPTVVLVSGASPSRAAVFTTSSQSVEIYERGAWWPGSMLGWRHDSGGTCQVWVRVEFAGVVEDAWVDLTLLRLPQPAADRHHALAREPKGASSGGRRAVRSQPVDPGSEVTQTQHLPLVREGAASTTGSRPPRAGGRRRAPETAEQSAPAGPTPAHRSPSLGRHRAPAPAAAGRHRAADTGVLAAVPAGPVPSVDHWAPPPPRTELPPAGPVVLPESARPQPDGDLLTRPMRLEEGVGSARRIRRESLTGV
jgi:hypothetical protein